MSLNKCMIIGNLGRDPEMRYTPNGVAVCSFPMATSETYKDRNSGERITQTEWHNIVIWRGMAETAEKYLRKGSQVFIEGKIKTRSWDDQQGQKRYTTEVVADVMQLLDRPGNGSPQVGNNQNATKADPQPQAKPANSAMAESVNEPVSSSPFNPPSVPEGDASDLPF